jgi:hypothetical protein
MRPGSNRHIRSPQIGRNLPRGLSHKTPGITMTYDHIRVTPLATHVGAEIAGVDLAGPPGGPEVAEIRSARWVNMGWCSSATSI